MRTLGFTSSKSWIVVTALWSLSCGEETTPGDTFGTGGAAGSASGSSGVAGASLLGGSSGAAGSAHGAGMSGAGGSSGSAGAIGTAGAGTAGSVATGGTGGPAGSGGAAAAGGTAGASTAGGASGFGGAAAASGASAGGAADGGTAGVSTGSGGASGSGGAGDGGMAGGGNETLCLDREGGAMIDVDVLGEKLRFWTTNSAFIDEVQQSLGEIPERIPLLALADGTDCDASWTFHIDPSSPRFEDDWIDICDVELSRIEGDKTFYLANGDFCPRFMRVERVETR